MRLRKNSVGMLCVAAVLCAPSLLGEEPGAADPPAQRQTPERSEAPEALVQELIQLRRELGSDILAGSVLDDGQAEEEFAGSLRTVIGLPPADGAAVPAPSPADSKQTIVTTVRQESARLDQLAHELECSRAYEQADRLRAIAQRLREAARPLDGRPHAIH